MFKNINEAQRQAWLANTSHALPKRIRILDIGAGELKNHKYCEHLDYVSQDFCQYHGQEGQHPTARSFEINTLIDNGDWYALLRQELARSGGMERERSNWAWPLAYLYALFGIRYFAFRQRISAENLACFGWQCVARKK